MNGTNEIASFDQLLGEISSKLLTSDTRRIDAAIRRAVVAIGNHYQVHRVDLRRFNEDRSATIMLNGWTSDDDVGLATDLSNDEAPWIASQVLRGQIVRIGNLEELPATGAGAGRMLMQADGLTAVLVVPLRVEKQIFGAIALASKTERDWPDEIVDQTQTLGELIAVAHSRARRVNKLLTSETRLRAVIEGQSEFIVRWLPDGTCTWVNDSFCEFFQQPRQELIGTSFIPLIAPEDRERLENHVQAFTRDSPTRTDDLRVIEPSGNIGWQRWRANGIFDGDGRLIEVQSLGRDITEQKHAEIALCDSESRFRDLVENSTDWIWEMDLDRMITYSNSNVEILLGYKVEEILKMSPEDLLHPEDLANARSILNHLVGWEQVMLRFRHKDGSFRILQSNALPSFDDSGNHVGFRGIDRDVTELVQTHEEILHRSEFQRDLARLSTRLLAAPFEETQAIAIDEFKRACERYGLFSGHIWTMAEDDSDMLNKRVGWRDENQISTPLPDQYPKARMLELVSKDFAAAVIKINNLDELPDAMSRERIMFRKIGIEAAICFSTLASSGLRGYCIFAASESRYWDDETAEELQLIANTLTAGCARHWAAQENSRNQQDLIRSQAVAGLGSYSIDFPAPTTDFSLEAVIDRTPEHYKLHGVEEKPEPPTQLLERIHADDYDRVISTMKKEFGSEQGIKQTYRLVRPDKKTIHVEGRIEYDKDEQGRVTRAFGIDHNVTEQVQARQKLETALAENQHLRDQLQQENTYLRDEIRVAHGFDRIIGNSPLLRRALALAEKVAPTGVSVLILGETGTGKELIAQSIHDLSDRKNNAMISVNCAALSKDLIESELFGHEKGSFTGAHERRKGRFELADKGTLFLDEIGELPGDLQAKLLRVLQSGEFERIGGTQTLNVDVRILAATNKDLRRAVDEGEFRADLFYRIGAFPIELPPLRERQEDIAALTEFLVSKHATRMGKDIQSISARTIRHLSKQRWPGNVRELEGVLQRALISARGPVLDYMEEVRSTPVTEEATIGTTTTSDLREIQRRHIVSVLESNDWVIDGKNGAASKLGVAASTLRSKMKRLGIERPN